METTIWCKGFRGWGLGITEKKIMETNRMGRIGFSVQGLGPDPNHYRLFVLEDYCKHRPCFSR